MMTDVVSPHNSTAKCLRKLFSFSNQDNDLYWAKTPLFPALYKAAGYNVTFLSNQECMGSDNGIWNSMNNVLVSESSISYLYDYVNSRCYIYDMDLVKEYEKISPTTIQYPNFVIFHLIGQHVDYNARYPEKDVVFTLRDYQDRVDLSDVQKSTLMHYDNATKYNDKVVASIIDTFRNKDAI
ncbi:MAG: sulfatase-like hydrolase/transferase, partial [Akkermansia sp.]|nr:sulfatase-like hydrolase/transferase [Akkermansia sp.]